jgi:hypothetical protein
VSLYTYEGFHINKVNDTWEVQNRKQKQTVCVCKDLDTAECISGALNHLITAHGEKQ